MSEKIKIYEINDGDFIIANSKKEAIQHYEEYTGAEVEEVEETDLNKKSWQPVDILEDVIGKSEVINIMENIGSLKDYGVFNTFESMKYSNSFIKDDYEISYKYDYTAVLLSFKQIIENEKILKHIDIPSTIATKNI